MSSDGTIDINCCVSIQENDTNIGDWCEYMKMAPIQGISTNTEKQYSFKKQYQ